MKKILAIIAGIVAIFALTTVPANAATRTLCGAAHNATACATFTYHYANQAGTANDYVIDTVKVEITGDKTGIDYVAVTPAVRRSDNGILWQNSRNLSSSAGWSVIFQPQGVTFGPEADAWFMRTTFLNNGNFLVPGQLIQNIV